MYLKSIKVNNFKSLEDITIYPEKINLLFGPNSSGKSSLMKALMFLTKNIYPVQYQETKYNIGENLNLGSYKDIVTNGDITKNIFFSLKFQGEFCFPKRSILDFQSLLDNFDAVVFTNELFLFNSSQEIKFDKFNDVPLFKILDNLIIENNINNTNKMIDKISFDYDISIEFNYNEGKKNNLFYIIIHDCKSDMFYGFNINKENSINNFFNYNMLSSIPLYSFYHKPRLLFNEKDALYDFESIGFLCSDGYYGKLLSQLEYGDNVDNEIKKIQLSFLTEFKESKYEKKLDIIYDSIKFLYITHRFIPEIIADLCNNYYLPTIRKIPNEKYLKYENKLNTKKYYKFLNDLRNYENQLWSFLSKGEEDYKIDVFFKDVFNKCSVDDVNKIKEEINCELQKLEKHYASRCINELDIFKKENNVTNENAKMYDEELRNIKKKYDQMLSEDVNYSKLIEEQIIYENPVILFNNWLLKSGFREILLISSSEDASTIWLVNERGEKINFINASSGLIQLFPVIFVFYLIVCKKNKKDNSYINTDFLLKKTDYSTLFIEQPEIHLHPKLQMSFAEILKEIRNDNDNLFMIETHSEHIIRKIQIMIAQNEINMNNVKVFYFKSESRGKLEIQELKIAENGNFITSWPEGFFDESATLILDLIKAQINRNN